MSWKCTHRYGGVPTSHEKPHAGAEMRHTRPVHPGTRARGCCSGVPSAEVRQRPASTVTQCMKSTTPMSAYTHGSAGGGGGFQPKQSHHTPAQSQRGTSRQQQRQLAVKAVKGPLPCDKQCVFRAPSSQCAPGPPVTSAAAHGHIFHVHAGAHNNLAPNTTQMGRHPHPLLSTLPTAPYTS
jgi:hypothetical protein